MCVPMRHKASATVHAGSDDRGSYTHYIVITDGVMAIRILLVLLQISFTVHIYF
jgi:hypothetical protein